MIDATLTDIKDECVAYGHHTPEYFDKMMHPVPVSPVVDRNAYIVEQCRGKAVLSLGHSGPLAKLVENVATTCVGIDMDWPGCAQIDLDENPESIHQGWAIGDHSHEPAVKMVPNLILLGEIIEHLANPGNVLREVRKFACPVLITVPNAFTDVGRAHLKVDQRENVNRDHVAYYSYWTLRRLVERYGFEVKEFYWYKGQPMFSEGLIMLVG